PNSSVPWLPCSENSPFFTTKARRHEEEKCDAQRPEIPGVARDFHFPFYFVSSCLRGEKITARRRCGHPSAAPNSSVPWPPRSENSRSFTTKARRHEEEKCDAQRPGIPGVARDFHFPFYFVSSRLRGE
ncbi:MAG: hypothetical protein RBU25_14715, partial [Lentisphaeria bacterium]|nr:hypothetical protein [Lentisphaeria bacterium]